MDLFTLDWESINMGSFPNFGTYIYDLLLVILPNSNMVLILKSILNVSCPTQ